MPILRRHTSALLLLAAWLSLAASVLPSTSSEQPAPPAEGAPVLGVDGAALVAAHETAAAVGAHPLCLDAATGPDGTGRYSLASAVRGGVRASAVLLDLSETQLTAALREKDAEGLRVLDTAVRVDTDRPLYSVVWIEEEPARESRLDARLTRQALETALYQNALEGSGPVRIRTFDAAGETFYAAVWLADRLGYRVGFDLTEVEYAEASARNELEGFASLDVAHGGMPGRLFATWVADPNVGASAYALGVSHAELVERDREHRARGLELVAVELDFSAAADGRYLAVWQRRPAPDAAR